MNRFRDLVFLKNNLLDYLIVLAIGLGILLFFFYFQSFSKLSWSDEIVYAVMGRNIVNGQGVISNFYHPKSILAKGFPLGDAHIPGHTFFLALSFLLLGQTEYAAFFPNHVAYVLSGILLFWLSSNLGNRWAGFGTSLLFYLFPPIISYANSAMAELTLIFVSIVYFAIWYKALTNPKRVYSILLVIILGLGMTIRETFILFLPSALYVLWLWPKQERVKTGIYFGMIFIPYILFIFWPFYQAKASYPHILSSIMDLETQSVILEELLVITVSNIKATLSLGGASVWRLAYIAQYLTVVFIAVLYFKFSKIEKQIVIYVLFSYLANFFGLVAIYPWWGWTGIRLFMFIMPPALILIGCAISRLKFPWLKYGTISLAACFLLYASVQANFGLTKHRLEAYEREQRTAELIKTHIGQFQPRAVMADKAFLYGWQAYPVIVVWRVTQDPKQARVLEEYISFDVVVVKEEDKYRLIDGVRQGVLKGNYQLVNETPFEGYHVFINADRLQVHK